jgi:hypothetical protein
MEFGGNASFKIVERGFFPTSFHYFSGHRYFDAEKSVAFAVLALPSLEETRQSFNLSRVLMGKNLII